MKRAMVAKSNIAQLMEQAGVHNFGLSAKSAKVPWIALIEIVQGFFSVYNQLTAQALLTPEQIEADFRTINHPFIMNFTPESLIQVQ